MSSLAETDQIPKVDYFLFNCGLHDIKTDTLSKNKQTPLLKYEKNLLFILQEVSGLANHTIWINTTPVNDKRHNTKCKDFFRYNKDVLKYNDTAKKIMRKNSIPIIDLYSFTRKCEHPLYVDHVHFTNTIYQKQAKHIAEFLLKQHHLNNLTKKREKCFYCLKTKIKKIL